MSGGPWDAFELVPGAVHDHGLVLQRPKHMKSKGQHEELLELIATAVSILNITIT